jgi:hypothetical protein
MANACEAHMHGNCSGSVNDYGFLFHTRPLNSRSSDYDSDDEQYINVDICDFHYELMVKANKGRNTETYGWNVEDALYNLFHCCEYKDKYTFWYCAVHDEGVLIKDQNTEEIPAWYAKTMCKAAHDSALAQPCDQMDWYKTGVINYDGKEVIEMETVEPPHFYNRMGGFEFKYYAYEYLVEDKAKKNTAKYVIFEEDSPIKKWFKMMESPEAL